MDDFTRGVSLRDQDCTEVAKSMVGLVAELARHRLAFLEHGEERGIPHVAQLDGHAQLAIGLAEELLRRASSDPLNRGIDEYVAQLPIKPGQDVGGVVGERLQFLLTARDGLLGLLEPGDVDGRTGDADGASLGIRQGFHQQLEMLDRALMMNHDLAPLANAGADHIPFHGLDDLGVLGALDQVAILLADHVRFPEPKPGIANPGVAQVQILLEQCNPGAFQCQFQPPGRKPQGFFGVTVPRHVLNRT